jgi:hypothetical protein
LKSVLVGVLEIARTGGMRVRREDDMARNTELTLVGEAMMNEGEPQKWRVELERYRADLERYRADLEKWKVIVESRRPMFEAAMRYAELAIRSLLLVAEGAAIALAGFAGHALGSGNPVILQALDLRWCGLPTPLPAPSGSPSLVRRADPLSRDARALG